MLDTGYVDYFKDIKITKDDYEDGETLKLTRNVENIKYISEINDILLDLTGKPNSSKNKIGLWTKMFGNKIINSLTTLGFKKVELCDNMVFDNQINEKYIKEYVKFADYKEYINVVFDVKQIRGIKYRWNDEKIKRLQVLFRTLKNDLANYNIVPINIFLYNKNLERLKNASINS